MQTFLPYSDFEKTAKCLDRQRLGKQRVEAMQIIRILDGQKSRWENHPAVKMWRGYDLALKAYFNAISAEWQYERGYKHNMGYFYDDFWDGFNRLPVIMPPWMGSKDFHRSHKSNLVRKKPKHYSHIFKGVPDNLPYIWPV